jgi:glycine reductase
MVTVGNANEVVTLPKMDRVIGDIEAVEVIAGGFSGSINEDGSITVEIQAITGSTNELGYSLLTTKGF